MEPLIKQNGAANATAQYLGKSEGHWVARAGDARQQRQGAVLAHRPHEKACRHRRAGHVSGRRPAQSGGLDVRRLSRGCPGVPQGRLPVWDRAWHDDRFRSTAPARSSMPSALSWSTPRARSRSRPTRCARRSTITPGWLASSPPDAPAWDDASNNKFLIAGKGSLNPEPTERLGGGQARCAPGRRTVVDPRHAGRAKRPLHALHPLFLGHLVVRQEQIGGQEPADVSSRSRRRSRRWWRPAKASISRHLPN